MVRKANHAHKQRTSSQNGIRASRRPCRALAELELESEEETGRRKHVCGTYLPSDESTLVKESGAKQAEKSGGAAYH